MRGAVPLILGSLLALGGCRQEPTFDERYDTAHQKIETMAREIDRDLGPADNPAVGNCAEPAGSDSGDCKNEDKSEASQGSQTRR